MKPSLDFCRKFTLIHPEVTEVTEVKEVKEVKEPKRRGRKPGSGKPVEISAVMRKEHRNISIDFL